MKIFNLFKSIPFILTFLIILLLNINNQKEYTKLKILIWDTPILSLGTYISISAGTGFIISYLFTNNLAKGYKLNSKKAIKFKLDNQSEDNKVYKETNNIKTYDNTLIERDINDPSPTINANFRVIGNTNRTKQSQQNNYPREYDNADIPDESDYQYYKQEISYQNYNEINQISNDWEDDTYLNW